MFIFGNFVGHAIKCYDCNSHNDTRCAMEEVPADLEVDCSMKIKDPTKTAVLCRKIKQVIDFEVNGRKFKKKKKRNMELF